MLATNQQLADLERFCTTSPSSVLSVYSTFNLGPFYVTPTTYHNLLVKTDRGNHPINLGPILTHQTKTSTVSLFCLHSDSNGWRTGVKAFSISFPHAVHRRCTIHLRQNVKDKLRSLNVPQNVAKEFLSDIFVMQTGSHFEAGLVDAESELSFMTALTKLKYRWNNLEKSCISSGTEPQFHAWFCKFKKRMISLGVSFQM